jgi:hypothetical protein
MSEIDLNPDTDAEDRMIEMICVRGTVIKEGVRVSPGDVFEVPYKKQTDGIPPLRWWIFNGKAARNEDEFARMTTERYNGRAGGPGTALAED